MVAFIQISLIMFQCKYTRSWSLLIMYLIFIEILYFKKGWGRLFVKKIRLKWAFLYWWWVYKTHQSLCSLKYIITFPYPCSHQISNKKNDFIVKCIFILHDLCKFLMFVIFFIDPSIPYSTFWCCLVFTLLEL